MTEQDVLFQPPDPPGDDFETFWRAYPLDRKRGKGKARASFRKARKKRSWPGLDGILSALDKAKRSRAWRDGYVPLPTTWLNQERWDDEWPEDDPSAPRSRSASLAAKRVLR